MRIAKHRKPRRILGKGNWRSLAIRAINFHSCGFAFAFVQLCFNAVREHRTRPAMSDGLKAATLEQTSAVPDYGGKAAEELKKFLEARG
jgi:hypothetical protein